MTSDFVIYDTVPARTLDIDDRAILVDEFGDAHQCLIKEIEDMGDTFNLYAYSEDADDRIWFVCESEDMVQLWT